MHAVEPVASSTFAPILGRCARLRPDCLAAAVPKHFRVPHRHLAPRSAVAADADGPGVHGDNPGVGVNSPPAPALSMISPHNHYARRRYAAGDRRIVGLAECRHVYLRGREQSGLALHGAMAPHRATGLVGVLRLARVPAKACAAIHMPRVISTCDGPSMVTLRRGPPCGTLAGM